MSPKDKNTHSHSPAFWRRFFLALAFFFHFSFGFYHLGSFVTADEHYWIYERIPQYWKAVKNQDWLKTRINDKPGVTLAWVALPGFVWNHFNLSEEIERDKAPNPGQVGETRVLMAAYRLPIIFWNAFFVFLLYLVMKRIVADPWIAVWGATLMLLSPVLLGISQIVNPDALLWPASAGALLGFIAFLKTQEKKHALFASFSLGFALLSKYVAIIIFPLLLLIKALSYFSADAEMDKAGLRRQVVRNTWAFILILLGALALYSLLLPAVFTDPKTPFLSFEAFLFGFDAMGYVYLAIVLSSGFFLADALVFSGSILKYSIGHSAPVLRAMRAFLMLASFAIFSFVLLNWMTRNSLINLENIPFDLKKGTPFLEKTTPASRMLLEYLPFVFSLTPLVVFSLLALFLRSIKKTSHDLLILSFSAAIPLFFLAVMHSKVQATIRYSILLYPLAAILAAVAFFEIPFLKKISRLRLSAAILAVSLASLYASAPFYFNYTNSLLPKKYIITDAWGYGGYEAAQLLNALPQAEKLVVWADYAGVCEFFIGRCITRYTYDQGKDPIDYYVLTRRGKINYDFESKFSDEVKKSKDLWVGAKKYYAADDPFWQLSIGGREQNYVKIFKAR